jgi:CGNR zinc finger/Putative stress-induced transcription regulator
MLRWLEELVNTRSIETGRDEIATPDLLGSWLRDRRLLPAGVPVTAEEHDRAVRIREGLRELIAANNAGPAAGDSARAGDGALADDRARAGDRAQDRDNASATDSAQPSRHARRDPRGPALASLAGLARRLPLVLDLDGSQPRLMPLSRGTTDTVLASLLGTVAEAVASGTWDRMKICRSPDCRWAYYDHSRNRSRAWCSMAACGNRAKARAFRTRGR